MSKKYKNSKIWEKSFFAISGHTKKFNNRNFSFLSLFDLRQ